MEATSRRCSGTCGEVKHFTEFNKTQHGWKAADGSVRLVVCATCDRANRNAKREAGGSGDRRRYCTINMPTGEALEWVLWTHRSKYLERGGVVSKDWVVDRPAGGWPTRSERLANGIAPSSRAQKCPPVNTAPEIQHSPFLAAQMAGRVKGNGTQTEDQSGIVYTVTSPSLPGWVVSGKGAVPRRMFDYNTYLPLRDAAPLVWIATSSKTGAEKWIQNLLKEHADEIGVPSARGPSEWFKFIDTNRAADLIVKHCRECPGFKEVHDERSAPWAAREAA